MCFLSFLSRAEKNPNIRIPGRSEESPSGPSTYYQMPEQLSIPKKSFKLSAGRGSKGTQNAREKRSSNRPSRSQIGDLSVNSRAGSSQKRKHCPSMIAIPCKSKGKAILQKQKPGHDGSSANIQHILADIRAKNGSAEELYLSGEPKLVTSVVRSPLLLELNSIDNSFMSLCNFYIEKSIGKISGISHLQEILTGFVNENKENLFEEDIFQDFMLHICSLVKVGLISSIQGKSIVQILVGSSDKQKKAERNDINRETSDGPVKPQMISLGDAETSHDTDEAQVNRCEKKCPQNPNGLRDNGNYSFDLKVVEMRAEIRMSSATFSRIGHLLPSGLDVKLRPDNL